MFTTAPQRTATHTDATQRTDSVLLQHTGAGALRWHENSGTDMRL